IAARDTTVDEVNAIMKAASESGPLAGILHYNTGPLVSVDFNHDPASSTFDTTLTKVSGRLVKVSSWYDNEWGFSNRMLDTTMALMAAKWRRPVAALRGSDGEVQTAFRSRRPRQAGIHPRGSQCPAGRRRQCHRRHADTRVGARNQGRAVAWGFGHGDVPSWPPHRRRMEGRGLAGARRQASFGAARD